MILDFPFPEEQNSAQHRTGACAFSDLSPCLPGDKALGPSRSQNEATRGVDASGG